MPGPVAEKWRNARSSGARHVLELPRTLTKGDHRLLRPALATRGACRAGPLGCWSVAPLRSAATIGAAICLLSLQACGAPDQGNAPAPERHTQPAANASTIRHEKERLLATVGKIVPKGWKLLRVDRTHAHYKVLVWPLAKDAVPVEAFGGIIPVGVDKEMVKLGREVFRDRNSSHEEVDQAAALYPDHEGYIKRISVETYGYDTKSGKDIREIEYFSREKHISCYGADPGQSTCYWGMPRTRFSLSFNSKDINTILPYVMTMVDTER